MDLCLIRSGNKETVEQAWDPTDWLRFRFSRTIRNRSFCKGTLISKKIMYPRSFSLWRFLRLVTDRISEKFFFVLWYVDCDRIYVPVSFQLWRLTNWLLVRYLRDLCLIRFGNKKAFEKLWGLTHAWIFQFFRGIQKRSYCYATSLSAEPCTPNLLSL